MGSAKINGYGTVMYHDDIYHEHMERTMSELRTRIEEHYRSTSGNLPPVGLSNMSKADLAAILAHVDSIKRFEAMQAAQQKSGPVV